MTTTPASAEPSVPASRPRVLVVDDEQPLLHVFSEALSGSFDVARATSVAQAENFLKTQTFNVVVADHLMPGGNGLDLLIRLKNSHPATQRILVTGFMKPEMLVRAVNEAALYRYLVKPISMSEFVRTVEAAAALSSR